MLIDGIDAAAAALESVDPGRGADQLLSMLREAQSGGVTVVAAGDRPALAGRLGSAFATKVLLRLNDPADYALAGIAPRLVPSRLPAGGGLLAPDGDIVQLAVLDPDPAVQDRMLSEALAGPRCAAAAPMSRLRALPRRIQLRELRALADHGGPAEHSDPANGTTAGDNTAGRGAPVRPGGPGGQGGPGRDAAEGAAVRGEVLLGVGGDSGHPVSLSMLDPAPVRLLIAGPAGSGRSNALALIADQLGEQGIRALLVADARRRRQSLRESVAWLDGGAAPPRDLAQLGDPQVVLIDDCHALASPDLGAWLADLVPRHPEVAFVAAGATDEVATAFRGIGAVLARARCGVLLCPAPTDPDLFSLRLPRTRAPFSPGRGILVGPDGPTPVQVALMQ